MFLLISPNKPEQTFKFEANNSILVGRSSECDIRVSIPVVVEGRKGDLVSRIHCTLILMCKDKSFYYNLYDGEVLGKKSTHGTWVNGSLINIKHRIRNRDKITFHKNIESPYLIALSDDELDTDSGGTLAQE